MAVLESTSYPSKAFSLRGTEISVVHKTEGVAGVTRTAVVSIEKVTFMDKGATRQVSSVTCTFLENVGVGLADTITLPGGQPKAILKVTVLLGDPGLRFDGFLTELLLA